MSRLQTGTPARLDGRTIRYEALDTQHGDQPKNVVGFSFFGGDGPQNVDQQVPVWKTHTTTQTCEIVRGALHKSVHIQATKKGTFQNQFHFPARPSCCFRSEILPEFGEQNYPIPR